MPKVFACLVDLAEHRRYRDLTVLDSLCFSASAFGFDRHSRPETYVERRADNSLPEKSLSAVVSEN